ncbi:hypothetical protein AAES_37210 [Amazona aestiva]|uniref:Uncharacterized protein n=1 Tax=Amazona aestiva TaxID=12930 RepID=A0A0Q3RJT0_AMAAE|nr:hypothetical protein AAES_37210 [Amazona aestiva]
MGGEDQAEQPDLENKEDDTYMCIRDRVREGRKEIGLNQEKQQKDRGCEMLASKGNMITREITNLFGVVSSKKEEKKVKPKNRKIDRPKESYQ